MDVALDDAYSGFKAYLCTTIAATPSETIAQSIESRLLAAATTIQTIHFSSQVTAEYYYIVIEGSTVYNTLLRVPEGRVTTSYEVTPIINAEVVSYNSEFSRCVISAEITPSIGLYNPFVFQTAVFQWRLNGDAQYISIPMTVSATYGNRAQVNIPGGTLSTGIVQWYVSGEDNYGESPESEVYTLDARNTYLKAEPILPKDGFFGNNEPIQFEWRLYSYSPNDVGRTDLQYSTNGITWIDLASVILVNYESRFYTAPANTFLAGTVYWRARAIGAHGAVGLWSDAITFEALGASVVTNLAASAVPFSTVSWEVIGELAYRIMVDNALFGPYRDPNAMSYTLAEPLTDGEHTIKVQAQNKYGLWSAWAETTVTITNVPGTAVVIAGEATTNGAELTITGGEQTGLFLVYRDGAHVARTPARLYKDRTALGSHAYYVIQAIADGYYTKSNTIEIVSAAECPEIALLSGGDFLTFGYSDSAYPEINVTRKTNAVKTHYSGAKFPTVETGDQEELSVSFGTFWLASDSDAADQLEAMKGKAVILKYPPNHVLVGVLDSLPGVDFGWKRAYTIYLEQMEWRDFTDES
jgi:hypothetical protein